MSKPFKPLLASPVEFDKLNYTDLWMSPKLDGIRAIVRDGVVVSRSLKPIPNAHVQRLFRHLEHYDGELICGNPTSPSVYRDTNSAVMSRDGEPNVTFYAFDHVAEPDAHYITRYSRLQGSSNVVVLGHERIEDHDHLLAIENSYLELGYEGAMLRKVRGPNSQYKFGRATAKSGTLLKLKRFSDHEYKVVGFEERMHNGNEAFTDELGRTKRSAHKENKVGRDDLGALVLEHPDGTFTCGTGFTDEMRRDIWASRDDYLGRWAKIKHFEIGVKTLPRFPVFLGWRSLEDM